MTRKDFTLLLVSTPIAGMGAVLDLLIECADDQDHLRSWVQSTLNLPKGPAGYGEDPTAVKILWLHREMLRRCPGYTDIQPSVTGRRQQVLDSVE